MKFQLALTTFLTALPLLTQALTPPALGNSFRIKRSEIVAGQPTTFDLSKRGEASLSHDKRQADDEWLVVMYDNGSSDQQCGGEAERVTGKMAGLCKEFTNLKGKLCADLKVNANIGVAKCDFSFRAESCSGKEENHHEVYKGKDSNGVSLSDKVKFVSVTCSE